MGPFLVVLVALLLLLDLGVEFLDFVDDLQGRVAANPVPEKVNALMVSECDSVEEELLFLAGGLIELIDELLHIG